MATKEDLNYEYDNICGIDTMNCVLGLTFSESAVPFQKAFLTLAHLMASGRDYVLKGVIVPDSIVTMIKLLSDIIYDGREEQK